MLVLVRRRDRFLERGVFFGQGGKRCPVEERKIKRGGVKERCASGVRMNRMQEAVMGLFLRGVGKMIVEGDLVCENIVSSW